MGDALGYPHWNLPTPQVRVALAQRRLAKDIQAAHRELRDRGQKRSIEGGGEPSNQHGIKFWMDVILFLDKWWNMWYIYIQIQIKMVYSCFSDIRCYIYIGKKDV